MSDRIAMLNWMTRIDQVKGVITLAVRELLSERSPSAEEESASALDLANEELQRLREEIDYYSAHGSSKL